MTKQEAETLAVLVDRVKNMQTQLNQNTKDTADIKSSLDNLSGGKQALMWFTGFLMTGLIALATYLGIHR